MVQLTPGSPAARIGLRTGDEIVDVESTPTSSLTYQQALDLVNSHADTLLMTVERYPQTLQSGPDLAGGRPGAQPNYGSISVTGASLGAHETRGSRP